MVNDFMMDWTGGGTHICAVNKNDSEKKKLVSLVQQILVSLPSETFSMQQKYISMSQIKLFSNIYIHKKPVTNYLEIKE